MNDVTWWLCRKGLVFMQRSAWRGGGPPAPRAPDAPEAMAVAIELVVVILAAGIAKLPMLKDVGSDAPRPAMLAGLGKPANCLPPLLTKAGF